MLKFRSLMPVLALLATPVSFGVLAGQGGTTHGLAPVTLKPVTAAEKAPDADGFLQRWVILEPISVGNQQAESASKAAVKTDYFTNQLTVMPHDGDKAKVGDQELTWHAVDTSRYNVNLYHFAHNLNKSASGVLFWAVTVVNCPQEMPNVRLAVGSNASSVWWVNGQEVIGIYGDRQTVIDDGVSRRLKLKQGKNVIRCAVINGSGATDFCARFIDTEGKPVKNLTQSVGDATH
jgi:hypothetical protein